MNLMNDDQLDSTLRSFFASESDRIAAVALSEFEMADRLSMKTSRPWDRRIIILLAAALLLVGIVSAAIVGSGLTRKPAEIDHSVPQLIAAGTCPVGYQDDVLLNASGMPGEGVWPFRELTLYVNGDLLSRPVTGIPTVRRLSPRGIQRVVDRVSGVPVEGNCRWINTGGPYHSLYLATDDGYLAVSWGADDSAVYPTSPAEKAAVEELDRWVGSLDQWLVGTDWVDATPRDCSRCAVAIVEPSPGPSVSTEPLPASDPCSVLTDEWVTNALGRTVSGEAHLSGLPGNMRDCVYFGDGFNSYLSLSLRQLATSVDDGRELARELFGTDASETIRDGARVYVNGCADAPLPCRSAIAISRGPYFVVLTGAVPSAAEPEQVLQELVTPVVNSLATR